MKYNGNNLQEVLDAHERWIEETDGWTEDDRADLIGADLRDADLRDANLIGADLIDAKKSRKRYYYNRSKWR